VRFSFADAANLHQPIERAGEGRRTMFPDRYEGLARRGAVML
jgi:hypothetical protein